jgi:membrane dipeptidase
VSHLSDRGFWDLVDITQRPIVATHSNARALCDHTRNLTDDMFRAIVQTGGVVGINFWVRFVRDIPKPAMEDMIAHIDRFMELGGAKHLCLGGDLDGCDKLAGGMNGVQDVPELWYALAARGYGRQELDDLFFNNLRRVLE